MLTAAARKCGIAIHYRTRALDLLFDGSCVEGVRIRGHDGVKELRAKSVVLACGGFEANAAWRTRYLGPGWDLAKVRGSRFNTGDGIRMALAIGAMPVRQLVGLPRRAVGHERARIRRPRGRRSIPETLVSVRHHDQRATVSASSTRAPISATTPMPSTAAWCWSSRASSPGRSSTSKVQHLLRDEYRIRQVTKVTANTIEEFATKARRRERGRIPRDDQGMQRGGAHRRAVRSEHQGRAVHERASRSTKATGRTRSTRRRSKAMP